MSVLTIPAVPVRMAACVLLLAGCSDASVLEPEPEATETAIPVEPDGGIGDGATPLPEVENTADFAKTMPLQLRGRWHIDDLDRAPTVRDCDPALRGTVDYDRLITVREGGYSYFETGGRIVEVHNRTANMIDATFDTTYADTPTSERRDFALQPDGTLAVNRDDGDGRMDVTQYRRCPKEG